MHRGEDEEKQKELLIYLFLPNFVRLDVISFIYANWRALPFFRFDR